MIRVSGKMTWTHCYPDVVFTHLRQRRHAAWDGLHIFFGTCLKSIQACVYKIMGLLGLHLGMLGRCWTCPFQELHVLGCQKLPMDTGLLCQDLINNFDCASRVS